MQNNPVFSIVTVIYKKEKQLPHFFEAILRQSFKGKVEIVVVIDNSPDNSLGVAERFSKIIAEAHPGVKMVIINNEKNLGNCTARNKGMSQASGDFLVIIDPDCLLSKNFFEEYFNAFKNADVVVSHFGIKLGNHVPLEALEMYEQNPSQVVLDRSIQDPFQLDSFLNCVTRGVAFKRSFAHHNLYDPQFSFTVTDKESGFGWEDIDAGYRLFREGAKFAFAERAFTIHIPHAFSADTKQKPLQSLKNYRRLHQKNSQIYELKKNWSLETYRKICLWHLQVHHYRLTEDMVFLDRHFGLGVLFHFSVYAEYLRRFLLRK